MAVLYSPHAKQVEAHRAFLLNGHKRGVLFWGRQVGKTMWSVNHAMLSAIQQQGTYFIVFKTYSQAAQVVWKQYLHMIPKELIHSKPNADELSITFKHIHGPVALPGVGWVRIDHDDDLPPSRIRLLGSDQADSHRGNRAHGIIFDEYADQSPDNWTSVYQPMFTTTNGWAIFMGTPKGYNHFYDLNEEAQENPDEYFYSKATWRDNPAVSRESIDRARADAERKGDLNAFLQEYELQFKSVQGAVYPEFTRDTHVLSQADMPDLDGMTHFATIDFGYVEGHPTAVNFIAIDSENNWYVYDEINVTQTQLDDVIEMMKLRMGNYRITSIIGDSARADLIAYMQQKGLPVIPAAKGKTMTGLGSVSQGIILMHQKLRMRMQQIGPPRPSLYIAKNCKNTILNFEQYKYPETKAERPPSEVPVKINDDHMDGLRYLALHLKFGLANNSGPGPRPLKFDQYGLPIGGVI